MPVIMIINLKGGVAKTTSAVAIAECLAAQGHRTLLIDADHQCLAGELLLGRQRQLACERSRRNLYDILAAMLDDEFTLSQLKAAVTHKVSNIGGGLDSLAVLPCSPRIDNFSENMAKARRGHHSNDEFLQFMSRRRKHFKSWLAASFDYCIIDCPPSLALQVRFLLSVSDCFIIPSVPDFLSVRGSLETMERIRSRGYKIPGIGTLWTIYRAQIAIHREMIENAAKKTPPLDRLPPPFATIIPNSTKIIEASDVERYRPASFRQKYGPFAGLFEELCAEINGRLHSDTMH